MKKCPTCEKTFDDNLRFCQSDGTPLVEAEPPIDPYKTMVAKPEDIAAALSADVPKEEVKEAVEESEAVLEIPEAAVDPKKTMYASEAEIREAMSDTGSADDQVMDIPPYAEPTPPEPPKFSEPKVTPPSFGDLGTSSPPPSPFSADPNPGEMTVSGMPIPSPFDVSSPDLGTFKPNEPISPLTPIASADPEPAASASPIAAAEWKPPAINDPGPQVENMQNPQFSQGGPPPAAGPNQTLAIVSLVVGILSLLCCTAFIPGIVAIVLGFMARGKANSDPMNYGGAGLALGGIICGALSLLGGLIVIVLYFLGFAASMMGNMR